MSQLLLVLVLSKHWSADDQANGVAVPDFRDYRHYNNTLGARGAFEQMELFGGDRWANIQSDGSAGAVFYFGGTSLAESQGARLQVNHMFERGVQ